MHPLQRPKSAYFFFMDDVRAKTRKDNPGASIGELGKLMGEAWNKIKGSKEADKYTKKAEEDKARYEKEMKEYNK